MVSDEQAVELYYGCISRSPQLREQSYRQLGDHLLPWARFGLRSDPQLVDHAPDCAQRALEIVCRKLDAGAACDQPENFVRWAAAIAINEGRQALRALHRTESIDRDLDGMLAHEAIPSPQEGPEALAIRRDLHASLNRALASGSISDASRRVLMGGYILQKSDDELATEMGEPRTNIRTIRSRDLARLRGNGPVMAKLSDFYVVKADTR